MEIFCIEDHIPVQVSGHSSKGNQLKWELEREMIVDSDRVIFLHICKKSGGT